MSWFIKKSSPIKSSNDKAVKIPEGMWEKCVGCKAVIYRKELQKNLMVCPKCDHHSNIHPAERLDSLFGEGGYEVLYNDIQSADPLGFKAVKKYKEQLKTYAKRGMEEDAVWVAKGDLENNPAVVCVMDFRFLGGSMGSVVGEKITRAIECAIEERRGVIVFSCSGGARMMEGALSLMQMAKVSAALARLAVANLPFISVMTDPTTGGVTASYAMLGDINIGEPKALIGFAGPRVIQQTIKQELPEGFQRSEFLLEHGMLDLVVHRKNMREKLDVCLRMFMANT